MRSNAARLGVLAAVIGVAVVLFIVLNNGGDDDNGTTTTATTGSTGTESSPSAPQVITVQNGEPVGGVKTLTYNKGDQVNFEVQLDKPEEEVHVHGYEIEEPADTSPVKVSFPANIDGIFEIELHLLGGGENEIAELRVNP